VMNKMYLPHRCWHLAAVALLIAATATAHAATVTLTVTNPSMDQPRQAEILIHGGMPRSASGLALAAADPHAHNSFEDPRAVEPKPVQVALRGSAVTHQFPPASVTRLTIEM
ncbi:MAG: hypothetical protein LAQ30_06435, partial [Acidobacteriia bacterium]|nr:hypothetical protein [Terriglobia bacterium]